MVRRIALKSGLNVTVEKFSHPWPQSSLIARIFPKKPIAGIRSTPTVIVGAHQDTVRGGLFGNAPGADDDGSGTITTLEAFTVLLTNGYQPKDDHILEFHWYAAEEVGLRGSQGVAAQYQREQRLIQGMIQFDMTGYHGDGKQEIGVITDYTDPSLTQFLRKLIQAYAGIPQVDTKCRYGCSDHASWNRAGFRSAFPFEGKFSDSSPFIHTRDDTIEHVDVEHMKTFSKVALSFAVELCASNESKE